MRSQSNFKVQLGRAFQFLLIAICPQQFFRWPLSLQVRFSVRTIRLKIQALLMGLDTGISTCHINSTRNRTSNTEDSNHSFYLQLCIYLIVKEVSIMQLIFYFRSLHNFYLISNQISIKIKSNQNQNLFLAAPVYLHCNFVMCLASYTHTYIKFRSEFGCKDLAAGKETKRKLNLLPEVI